MKVDPVAESFIHIGPDFGDDIFCKWWYGGAMHDTDIIYCPPEGDRRGILKIDTNTDDVTELDVNLLPEQGDGDMWASCALAIDGCMYFMPAHARRIMKLDPNNGDAMSSVGDDLGGRWNKFRRTVVGIDGCVYGIPCRSTQIVKYDAINDITSFIGEEDDEAFFRVFGNGALGRDGCIYAVTRYGVVLKILDTNDNSYSFVYHSNVVTVEGWRDAIMGIDGCIYCWPPYNDNRTLKYDRRADLCSLVYDTHYLGVDASKCGGGALAPDGVIYCFPMGGDNRILSIDPLEEFSSILARHMENNPGELGNLFQMIEGPEGSAPLFGDAVVKFGEDKVLKVLDKHVFDIMGPVHDFCQRSNLFPFMIAASLEESAVLVIYHFLRRDLPQIDHII